MANRTLPSIVAIERYGVVGDAGTAGWSRMRDRSHGCASRVSEQTPDAHRCVEGGNKRGNLVVRPTGLTVSSDRAARERRGRGMALAPRPTLT